MGPDLKLTCMDCKAALRVWFSEFPGVYTGRMGCQKFQDMVQKMCEEGVKNGVSRWRDDVFEHSK